MCRRTKSNERKTVESHSILLFAFFSFYHPSPVRLKREYIHIGIRDIDFIYGIWFIK